MLVPSVMRKQTLRRYEVGIFNTNPQNEGSIVQGSSLFVSLIIIELPDSFSWYMFLFITL